MRAAVRLLTITLLSWLALAGPASAHDVPPGIVMLDVGHGSVDAELLLPFNELAAAAGLPVGDGSVAAWVDVHRPQLRDYVISHLGVRDREGTPWQVNVEDLEAQRTDNPNWVSNDWIAVRTRFVPPGADATVAFIFDDTLIVHRVVSHNELVYVRRDLRNGLLGDHPMPIGMVGLGRPHLAVDGSGGSWWRGFEHLVRLGMDHIATGPDHLLFLLTLLLPAPQLPLAGASFLGHWLRRRSVAGSLWEAARTVSGFTLGHSLTLALAACGAVEINTRLIEVLIAVSILVSGLNAVRPLFCGRVVLIAAGFGLVHGLAFAETLSGLNFDGWTLVLSVLGFNLGIEAMQLLVIAGSLPLLVLLARLPGYGVLRMLGALFAMACACGWILERAANLHNPLEPVVDFLTAPPQVAVIAVCAASALSCAYLWCRSRGFVALCYLRRGGLTTASVKPAAHH